MVSTFATTSLSARRRPGSSLRCFGSCANLSTSGWAPAFAGVTLWVGRQMGQGNGYV